MITRLKLIAATLGFVIAAGAIGDASANTVAKTTTTRTIAANHVKVVVRPHHRLHFGARIVRHVRIVHRAPSRVTVVRGFGPRVVTKKIVRINRTPLLQRHAMVHRTGTKTIVVR